MSGQTRGDRPGDLADRTAPTPRTINRGMGKHNERFPIIPESERIFSADEFVLVKGCEAAAQQAAAF
jgi:hypothetical protein